MEFDLKMSQNINNPGYLIQAIVYQWRIYANVYNATAPVIEFDCAQMLVVRREKILVSVFGSPGEFH